jgi:hypothetical protein
MEMERRVAQMAQDPYHQYSKLGKITPNAVEIQSCLLVSQCCFVTG